MIINSLLQKAISNKATILDNACSSMMNKWILQQYLWSLFQHGLQIGHCASGLLWFCKWQSQWGSFGESLHSCLSLYKFSCLFIPRVPPFEPVSSAAIVLFLGTAFCFFTDWWCCHVWGMSWLGEHTSSLLKQQFLA